MIISRTIKPADLLIPIQNFWAASGQKIDDLNQNYDVKKGSPVFTVKDQYIAREAALLVQRLAEGKPYLKFF